MDILFFVYIYWKKKYRLNTIYASFDYFSTIGNRIYVQ